MTRAGRVGELEPGDGQQQLDGPTAPQSDGEGAGSERVTRPDLLGDVSAGWLAQF